LSIILNNSKTHSHIITWQANQYGGVNWFNSEKRATSTRTVALWSLVTTIRMKSQPRKTDARVTISMYMTLKALPMNEKIDHRADYFCWLWQPTCKLL